MATTEKLLCWSDPLRITISDYKSIGFKYGPYTILDQYEPPAQPHERGQYRIAISTPELSDSAELNRHSLTLQHLTEEIKMFMKYVTSATVFDVAQGDDKHRKRTFVAGDCTPGWQSNYKNVDRKLRAGEEFTFDVEFVRYAPDVSLPESPLFWLKVVIEQYPKVDERIRYLMRLNYEADLATPVLRYMAYGKVLEIINVLYPMVGKRDHRIEEHFPELKEQYADVTIKRLMDWANNRAESRHYIGAGGQPHEPFSYEELGIYGPMIDNLAINVVRKAMGLEPVVMVDRK